MSTFPPLPPIEPTPTVGPSPVYCAVCNHSGTLQQFLAQRGVPTLIYYPLPLHQQKLYADLGYRAGDLPRAEAVSRRILPLPMYPELTDEQVDYVIATIRAFGV